MKSTHLASFICVWVLSIWTSTHGKPSPGLPMTKLVEVAEPPGPIPNTGSTFTNKESHMPGRVTSSVVTDYFQHSNPMHHNQILIPGDVRKVDQALRKKRTPTGFTARGFHEGVFDRDFGHFSPVKRTQKRRPEADAAGFYGDTFSNGFGEFETMKRDASYLNEDDIRELLKRTEMGANGFHGDTFTQGFGDFGTMKKRLEDWMGTGTVKRKPEMTKSGFHGDTFNSGFGEFHPMKK